MLKLPVKSPIVNENIDLSEYAKKSDVDAIGTSLDNKADKKEVEKISSQLDTIPNEIMKKLNTKKYSYKQPSEFLNIDFSKYPEGTISTLENGLLTTPPPTTSVRARIENDVLTITGSWSNGNNVLRINKNPNNKRFRIKVKSGNYLSMTLRHNEDYSKRLLLWTGYGDKKIGLGVVGSTSTLIQELIKSDWTIPTNEDYWIEVKCGLVATGEKIEINCWSENTETQTLTYTFLESDTKITTGFITINAQSGATPSTASIKKIEMYDGYNYENELKENYYYLGRWYQKWVNDKDVMTTINNGSRIYCQFTGTTFIDVNFEIPSNLTYKPIVTFVLNGTTISKREIASTIRVGEGMTKTKIHKLEIYVNSVYWKDGAWGQEKGLYFSGIAGDNGMIVEPYFPQEKRFGFKGDSITNGCTLNGATETILSNSDGALAYPKLVADKLGMIPIQIGYPGTGLFKTNSDGMANMMTTVDYKSVSQLQTDETLDILLYNIGTNDTGNSTTEWKTRFKIIIDKDIQRYGNIPMFICKPFTSNNFIAQMKEIADEYPNILYIDTTGVSCPTTDGTHPNVTGHENEAEFIVEFIKNNLSKLLN